MDRAAMSALCHDGEDGAEADRHERAVPCRVRERCGRWSSWWNAVTRIVEKLEDVGGEDDEQGKQKQQDR